MVKKIICGEIGARDVNVFLTPIEKFEKAWVLSKQDSFTIETNDTQMIEALEVFCGEENIQFYIRIDNIDNECEVYELYEYIGDVYQIINEIRFTKDLGDEDMINDSFIYKKINEYNKNFIF